MFKMTWKKKAFGVVLLMFSSFLYGVKIGRSTATEEKKSTQMVLVQDGKVISSNEIDI